MYDILNSKGQEINGTPIYLVVKLLSLQADCYIGYNCWLNNLRGWVEQGSSEYQIVNFPPSNHKCPFIFTILTQWNSQPCCSSIYIRQYKLLRGLIIKNCEGLKDDFQIRLR